MATRLTSSLGEEDSAAISPDGKPVAFSADYEGPKEVYTMPIEGGIPQRRTFDGQANTTRVGISVAPLSDGQIVYQLSSDLHVYNIAKNQDRTIQIELPSDFDNLREHWIKEPLKYTTPVHFSGDGEKVVLTSRGRVFVEPVKHGRFVDISEHRPGRFREARLSTDGKSVYVFSTESGEVKLWKYPSRSAKVFAGWAWVK